MRNMRSLDLVNGFDSCDNVDEIDRLLRVVERTNCAILAD